MKAVFKRLISLCCCIAVLISIISAGNRAFAYVNTGVAASDIVETAKAEIGYKAQGKTKYCEWTSDVSAERAAAFVLWCANTAGISDNIIPRKYNNAALLSSFRTAGLFSVSAFLGGDKKPTVGSLIFITSSAGNYNSLTRIGIVTQLSGMTVYFIEDGFSDAVSSSQISLYNTSILGYAFPSYEHTDGYKTGVYQLNETMNFRSGPDTSYEQLKNSSGTNIAIPSGTSVTVTAVKGSWGYIVYMGKMGWIKLDWSTFIGEPTPAAEGEWLIVDISQYQLEEKINWTSLKSAGVSGAVLRIGGRYYGEKNNHIIYDDDEFSLHYNGAKAAGLSVGVYFFSAAYTEERAQEEAAYVLDKLNEGKYILDLPVFIDIEDVELNYKPHYSAGKQVCTMVTEAFCDKIETAGYYAGIYCSKDFAEVLLEPSVFTGRAVWIAQYNDECTYTGNYHMWQYTRTGVFPGYSGPLDMSKCYYDLSAYIKSEGYNGFAATGEKKDDWIITENATCTHAGTEVLRDSQGINTVIRYIPATSHTSTQAIVIGKQLRAGYDVSDKSGVSLIPYDTYKKSSSEQSSFSSQGGSIIEYCSVCKKVIEAENIYTGACQHKSSAEKTERNATCSAEGLTVIYCSSCNKALSSKLTAVKEHNTVQTVLEATCTKEGTVTTKCKDCGTVTYYRNNGFAEHSGIWNVSVAARALVAGKEICKCTVCGKESTREIPALMLCDVDKDSAITSADARLALRIAVNLDSADEAAVSVADADNDKNVTSADARLILRLSVKLDNYSSIVEKYYNIKV